MKTMLFVLMLFVASTLTGQTIDLYKLTLNDSILRNLTVDQLTNMLGRPSAIESNENLISHDTLGLFGPRVFYHDKGLEFSFYSQKRGQKIQGITIYFVKKWDGPHQKFYYPYLNTIFPKLNGDMKIDNIIPLFKKEDVVLISADELKERTIKLNKALGLSEGYLPGEFPYTLIRVDIGKTEFNFACEKITKFLESVNVILNKDDIPLKFRY